MRRTIFLLVAGLATLLCAGCVQLELTDDFDPPPGTLLFSSTFDNGSSAEWAPVPDERYWIVKDGRYGLAEHAPSTEPQKTYGRLADWNGLPWQDYSITAQVVFESSTWYPGPCDDYTSILFHVVDDANYMELRFEPFGGYERAPKCQYPGPPGAGLILYSVISGKESRLGGVYVGLMGQAEYRVTIELRGQLCLVYEGMHLVLSTEEMWPCAGGIGFQTAASHKPSELLEPASWYEVWFDDVYVKAF